MLLANDWIGLLLPAYLGLCCQRILQVLEHQIVPLRSPVSGVLQPLHLPGVKASSPSLHSREHHSPGLLELVKRVSPKTFPHLEQASSAHTSRSKRSFLTCSRLSSIAPAYCSSFHPPSQLPFIAFMLYVPC